MSCDSCDSIVVSVERLEKLVKDVEAGVEHISRSTLEELATTILIQIDRTTFDDRTLRKRLVRRIQNLVPETPESNSTDPVQTAQPPAPPAARPARPASSVPDGPAASPVPARTARSARPARSAGSPVPARSAASPVPAVVPPSRKRARKDCAQFDASASSELLRRCRVVYREDGKMWFRGIDGARYMVVQHEMPFHQKVPCFAMQKEAAGEEIQRPAAGEEIQRPAAGEQVEQAEGEDVERAEGEDVERAEGEDVERAECEDVDRAEGEDVERAEGEDGRVDRAATAGTPVGYAVLFGGYGSCGRGRAYCDRLLGTCWHRRDPCLFRIMSVCDGETGKFGPVPDDMALVSSPGDWSGLEALAAGFTHHRGPADMYKRVVRCMGCEPAWRNVGIADQEELERELEAERVRYFKELGRRR